MSEKRLFPGRAVNTIIGMQVVCISLIKFIGELINGRSNYTPEYAQDLSARVRTVGDNLLGKNGRESLFAATSVLQTTMSPIRDTLISIKKNVEVDFVKGSAKCNEILEKMGYGIGTQVSRLTQPDIVLQLTKIKRNTTPEFIAEITSKGMSASLPNFVIVNADLLIKANATQEQLKSSAKGVTANTIREINTLYLEITGICKIAADFYKKDPLKKELFTFSKILRNIGDTRPTSTEESKSEVASETGTANS